MKSITATQIEEAKKLLKDAGYFGITWTVDDIIIRASDDNYTINQKQAEEIVLLIEKNHDCSIGINWDSISSYIEDYCINNDIETNF